MTYRRDHNELLLFLCKQLINDQLSYLKHKSKTLSNITEVSIAEEDFIDRVSSVKFEFTEILVVILTFYFVFGKIKARQLKINNVKQFYESDVFRMMKYQYDSVKKTITQSL